MATKQKEQKPLHLAKLHVHKGDTILVLTGKDRGKRGVVARAMPRANKVIVDGINIAKKHVKGPMGVRGRNSDNTLLRRVLGWEPEISLEQGLERTYHWIEEQLRIGMQESAARKPGEPAMV